MNLGGCVVSKNILEGKGRLTWCIKEDPVNDIDNGWRFFADIDDDDFLSNPDNTVVCAWDTVVEIEPAILMIFNLPTGTELLLEEKDGKKCFVNPDTGEAAKI